MTEYLQPDANVDWDDAPELDMQCDDDERCYVVDLLVKTTRDLEHEGLLPPPPPGICEPPSKKYQKRRLTAAISNIPLTGQMMDWADMRCVTDVLV